MKRKIIISIIIISFIFSIAYYFVWYIGTTQSNIVKKDVLQTKTPITNLVNLGDAIVICTYGGEIVALDTSGKILWQTKIDSSIFNICENNKEGILIVAGVNFYVFNKNGEQVFKKGFKNYIGVKGKCLSNGNIILLYQSLTNLSYIAITTDKTGKTLLKEEIPDLGESSQIDISHDGELLFTGERGELYLIDKDGVEKNTQIKTNESSLHSVYGYFIDDKIVAGFKLTDEEGPSIPVFFYNKDFQIVSKVSLHSNINNILLDHGHVVFATENKFITFDESGKELGKIQKLGFSPFSFSSNNDEELYLYIKTPVEKHKKNIYNISVIRANTETIKYIFSSNSIPTISLGKQKNLIFIVDGNALTFIYPK